MSKKAKAASKERRQREKRARKEAQQARYKTYRDAGMNSKRKSRQDAKFKGSLKIYSKANRNRRHGNPTLSLAQFCKLQRRQGKS